MSDKTGKLTFTEFGTLARLLRRFEVHHTAPSEKAVVMATQQHVREVYCDLYVPNSDPAERPTTTSCSPSTAMVPMTAGPNPIPVSELLNAETPHEQLSAYIAMGEHR